MAKKDNKIFRILFVCTGNTCRSPMAHGIMRKMAADDGLEYFDVESAGTNTYDGYPPSAFGVQTALKDGIGQ